MEPSSTLSPAVPVVLPPPHVSSVMNLSELNGLDNATVDLHMLTMKVTSFIWTMFYDNLELDNQPDNDVTFDVVQKPLMAKAPKMTKSFKLVFPICKVSNVDLYLRGDAHASINSSTRSPARLVPAARDCPRIRSATVEGSPLGASVVLEFHNLQLAWDVDNLELLGRNDVDANGGETGKLIDFQLKMSFLQGVSSYYSMENVAFQQVVTTPELEFATDTKLMIKNIASKSRSAFRAKDIAADMSMSSASQKDNAKNVKGESGPKHLMQ